MHNKFALLLNPVAGKGKALRLLPGIAKRMDSLGLEYQVFVTERNGHATALAREAGSRGFTAVIAAGGDGTCNEVINGLIQGKERDGTIPPLLGVLPIGRGNDFAYGAGIPRDLDDACDVLGDSYISSLDVGRITGGFFPEGRCFGNGIGIGFDTIVGLRAARHKVFHGALSYIAGALETLCIYPKAPELDIEYSGATHHLKTHQISILNGRRMGGVFFMAPEGDHTDGLLDLCMVTRPMSRREMITLMMHYTKGTQASSPIVCVDRAPSFRISAPAGGLVCHADGETVCTDGTELMVECLPGALSILCKNGLPEALKK